jgi:hypothetical protein
MAHTVSISILVVAWVICMFMQDTNMVVIAPGFVAASVSSSALEQEAKALMESGWWSYYSFNYTSGYCQRQYGPIYCNDDGSVIGIYMEDVYVGDNVRKFNFSSFPNLVRIGFRNIGLRGSIPQEIGTLSKLTYIDLSLNNLGGSIPDELGKLKNLLELDLSYNKLTGSIPSALGLLTNLYILDLSCNKLTGSIPSALGLLTNLNHLRLSFNEINGSIVPEIGLLKNLSFLHLYLDSNQITVS